MGSCLQIIAFKESGTHKLSQLTRRDSSVYCSTARRKDGNTILHSAISGEYFGLAYQIISYYPKLISCVNVDGETPLHILAKKPNVFKSNSQLGFYDSIIYHCLSVAELKQQRYNPWASQNGYSSSRETIYPENYRTCVNIFFCLSAFTAIFSCPMKRYRGPTNDEEIQQREENDEHVFPPNYTARVREENDGRFFPPNYTTCVSLFKFAKKFILTGLAIGIWRIQKIQEMKQQHSNAFHIMSEMIEHESIHMYKFNGQWPIDLKSRFVIPETPPEVDEYDAHHITKTNSSSGEKAPSPSAFIFDTPLLAAIKTGILEMVKKIINRCPVATQDLDSNGKNVLMLAAENKQTLVFNYLLQIGLPEYMFYHLDKDGNNALHLAAMLDELQPWRIYGATLQMQWEIKWYEHVKTFVPPASFVQQNAKGKTPMKAFTESHADLVKEGKEWIVKTSESCSVVAALIATVAFATSATVPGGPNDQTGHPILENHTAFDIFSITSLIALSLYQ